MVGSRLRTAGPRRRAAATHPVPAVPAPTRTAGRERDARLDFGRAAAIAAVVLIHVASPVTDGYRSRPLGGWLIAIGAQSLVRWCVPVFVMLSGALLLNPARPVPAGPFYRRRLRRIVIPLLAWSVFYIALQSATGTGSPELRSRTVSGTVTVLLAGRPSYHLYFLFLMLGLYLVTPFVAELTRTADRRLLGLAATVVLLLGCADTSISWWTTGAPLNGVSMFVPYLGYYLAGCYLYRHGWRAATSGWLLLLGVLVLAAGTAALTVPLVARYGVERGYYLFGYLSPTVMPAAVAVFALVLRRSGRPTVRFGRWAGWTRRMSDDAFGVFLVHPAITGGYRKLVGVPTAAPAVAGYLIEGVVAVFAISVVITEALRRLPATRALVGE